MGVQTAVPLWPLSSSQLLAFVQLVCIHAFVFVYVDLALAGPSSLLQPFVFTLCWFSPLDFFLSEKEGRKKKKNLFIAKFICWRSLPVLLWLLICNWTVTAYGQGLAKGQLFFSQVSFHLFGPLTFDQVKHSK